MSERNHNEVPLPRVNKYVFEPEDGPHIRAYVMGMIISSWPDDKAVNVDDIYKTVIKVLKGEEVEVDQPLLAQLITGVKTYFGRKIAVSLHNEEEYRKAEKVNLRNNITRAAEFLLGRNNNPARHISINVALQMTDALGSKDEFPTPGFIINVNRYGGAFYQHHFLHDQGISPEQLKEYCEERFVDGTDSQVTLFSTDDLSTMQTLARLFEATVVPKWQEADQAYSVIK